MRLIEKIREVSDIFKKKSGLEFPWKEAESICLHILGCDRVYALRDDPVISPEQGSAIDESVRRRLKGEPLQYITGTVEFMDLIFNVGKGVLIPRPETELLVLAAIGLVTGEGKNDGGEKAKTTGVDGGRGMDILDLCTGSGCIAVTLGARFPGAKIIATDMSENALGYARKNAERNNVSNVTFLQGDLFEHIDNKRFDLIISNPPYIRSGEIPLLQREIREWEPILALDGGADGLNVYRRIIEQLDRYLSHDGCCLLEIGYDQREDVASFASEQGLTARFLKDMAGLDRIAVLTTKDS